MSSPKQRKTINAKCETINAEFRIYRLSFIVYRFPIDPSDARGLNTARREPSASLSRETRTRIAMSSVSHPQNSGSTIEDPTEFGPFVLVTFFVFESYVGRQESH